MSADPSSRHGPSEQRNRELFFWLISQHLKNLYHFVRHQIAYFQASGDLLPGELTAEEVVDAVILRAYRAFAKNPREGKIKAWLIQLAREHLQAEVKRWKSWRNRTPARTGTDIPDVPPEEWVTTLGEERLDFYEPDEDLKLEDVLPDLELPTPEDEAETREVQACVSAALAGLPGEWRRALLLRHVDGLAGSQLAQAIGKPEPEVQRILEHAGGYLRERLLESGCRFKASG